ncbi:MAG: glycosyltransferase family 2 protein, partial [Oceanospirillales bacterium]|nr:glycosyltransferase family 2 protein [Oceanospirillales bacterium]
DDGSCDDSHDVISDYSEHPKVTTILNTQNRGQSAVLNQALAASRGKYVALLPSDDWFLPDKTALQVAKMEVCDEDVGVIYAAGARYFEDTCETLPVKLPVRTGWIAQDLIKLGNFIYPVTPLYRREAFEKARPSEQFKAEGEAIHLRIALHFRYEYVDQIVAVMRDHSYNIGKDADVMYAELMKFWEWYFEENNLPRSIRDLAPSVYARVNATKGIQFIVDKHMFKEGRRCLLRALRHRPITAFRWQVLFSLIISVLPVKVAVFILNNRP